MRNRFESCPEHQLSLLWSYDWHGQSRLATVRLQFAADFVPSYDEIVSQHI